MAENAYIAPGFHRLLTAGGLTLGLMGGRSFMDVLTARNAATGDDISRAHTPELIRPLHGLMRYNPYSDKAADRWKFVADQLAPVTTGALGAFFGGRLYFHGKQPNNEPFFAPGAGVERAFRSGRLSTEVTDAMLRLKQSDATRKWAAATFVEGSATGMHLPGALSPFNNGMIAVSFQQGAGRNISFPFLGPLNRALGNHGAGSRFLYGAMRDTTKWMETNVTQFATFNEWAPEAEREAELLRRARDALQKFPERTAEQEQNLVSAFKQLITDAYAHKAAFFKESPNASSEEISQKLYAFVSGAHNPKRGLLGASFDHLLHQSGVDLSSAALAGDPFAFFSRLFGSRPHELDLLSKHAHYLNTEFNYGLNPAKWANEKLYTSPWKVAVAYGGGAAAIAAALGVASYIGHKLHHESGHSHKPHIVPHPRHHANTSENEPVASSGNDLLDAINGKPLDVAQWVSRVIITPPSMHRFMNAAYLSAVLYAGVNITNVLTGRKLGKITSGNFLRNQAGELVHESVLALDKVWAPLKPLHGLLSYTPGSALAQDRWRQAMHFIIPVGLGMFGTYTGSHFFFADRIKSLKNPDTLEDYTDRISLEQSKFYAGATALTSIFNTGSGIHLLPIFNYSSNLHNRYLLGSGQQVAMPGIGKWWSGNAGTTPWGVKRTLQHMTSYLTYNEAARPHELPTLVHSLIGKLYPDLSEDELLDKKQIFLDRIHDVRDSYLVEGVIPASKQAALGEAMHKLFSGKGFEALLKESNLDPLSANLAANGASGAIANVLGQRGNVERLQAEYREKYAARSNAQAAEKPADFLRGLLDHGPRGKVRLGRLMTTTHIEAPEMHYSFGL